MRLRGFTDLVLPAGRATAEARQGIPLRQAGHLGRPGHGNRAGHRPIPTARAMAWDRIRPRLTTRSAWIRGRGRGPLDTVTEAERTAARTTHLEGRTRLIAAHRAATAARCDLAGRWSRCGTWRPRCRGPARLLAVTLLAAVAGPTLLDPLAAALVPPPLLLVLLGFPLSLRALTRRSRAVVPAEEQVAARTGEVLIAGRDVFAPGARDHAAAGVKEATSTQVPAGVSAARFGAVRVLRVPLGGHVLLLALLPAGPWLVKTGIWRSSVPAASGSRVWSHRRRAQPCGCAGRSRGAHRPPRRARRRDLWSRRGPVRQVALIRSDAAGRTGRAGTRPRASGRRATDVSPPCVG